MGKVSIFVSGTKSDFVLESLSLLEPNEARDTIKFYLTHCGGSIEFKAQNSIDEICPFLVLEAIEAGNNI